MNILNIEIKVKYEHPEKIEKILIENHARFIGEDHQIDTYFQVDEGKLKLREGNIENSLILYIRDEQKGLKRSEILLYKPIGDSGTLKQILTKTLGISVIVDKRRKIFFIDNVKFHIDNVKDLGFFVEIEAIDATGEISEKRLKDQCNKYIKLLELTDSEFLDLSYSDMLLNPDSCSSQ